MRRRARGGLMSGGASVPRGYLSTQALADLRAVASTAANSGVLDMTKAPAVTQLFTLDIERAVRRFADQTEILEQQGILHPVVAFQPGEAVLDVLFSEPQSPFVDTGNTSTLRQAPLSNIADMVFIARQNAQLAGFSISDQPTPTARDIFERDLADFLVQRARAAGGAFGSLSAGGAPSGGSPGTPAVPGVNISVTTVSSSLHIISSPAFFPNVRTQFGNIVSSPVPGSLGPGLYLFGAYGTGVALAFEPLPFSIPATTTVNITVV